MIGSDDTGECTDLGRHVCHSRPLVDAQRLDGRPCILDDLADRLTVADVRVSQNLEHVILCCHVRGRLATDHDLERLRDLHPHILGDPRIEDRCSAYPKGNCTYSASMWGMGVGSDDQHARLSILL